MAEKSPKRQREEESSHQDTTSSDNLDASSSSSKRQKPYTNILNLLDEDEEAPSHELSQDLSAIFTTLQQELSSSAITAAATTFDFESLPYTAEVEAAENTNTRDEDDESVKSVMRHLLEASDDELGIPNTRDENGVENFDSTENLPFAITDHGLWELEDVTANYYTVLQSELFM